MADDVGSDVTRCRLAERPGKRQCRVGLEVGERRWADHRVRVGIARAIRRAEGGPHPRAKDLLRICHVVKPIGRAAGVRTDYAAVPACHSASGPRPTGLCAAPSLASAPRPSELPLSPVATALRLPLAVAAEEVGGAAFGVA